VVSATSTASAAAASSPSFVNDFSVVAVKITLNSQIDPSIYDAIIARGATEYGFASVNPTIESAFAKARILEVAFRFAKPGDVLTIEPGTFDFGRGGPYYLPPCVVQGSGRGVTTLKSEKMIDADGTPGQSIGVSFALQDGTILEDCSLITTPYATDQDGGCVGFAATTTGAFAIVRRCDIQANDWAVYNWSAGNSLSLVDSTITSGRVCIAAEDSGDGQQFSLLRCTLIGDASLSSSTGDTSNQMTGGVFGVVARGGKVQLIDCDISLKGRASVGPSWTPRTCGITDVGGANDIPASVDEIVLENLTCHINPNGCDPTRCFDLDLKYPYVQAQLQVTLGSGSAPDGTLSKSWTSPSAPPSGAGAGGGATIPGSATGGQNTAFAQVGGTTNWVSPASRPSDATVNLSLSPVVQPLALAGDVRPIIVSIRHRVSLSLEPLKDLDAEGVLPAGWISSTFLASAAPGI